MTKDWDGLREVILDLYKRQGKTLAETRRLMEENHGFKASTRAYRSRLKRWGVTKYTKPPRRGSAPVGSAAAIHTMPGSAAMAPSRTYPGAAGPARTRPTTSSSHALSPYSSDANSPQLRDDMYESSNDHYSSVVSPQIQAIESLPCVYSPSLLQQQQQQQQPRRYIPQRGYHAGLQPEHHQINNFYVPNQNQTHQAAPRPRLAITSPHRQQQIHSRPEPKAATCFDNLLQTLLSTQVSTTQADADRRIDFVSRNAQQLVMLGRLDDRVFRVDERPEILLTALELCVFTYMAHHSWAPRFFFQLCSTLVRHGASTERIVPQGFRETVHATVHGHGTGPMTQLLASHQQQQQYGAILCESPVTPIWLSACKLHLRGDGVAVGEHLSILEAQHQLQPLQPLLLLLPELSYSPISPVSLQHAPNVWSP